MSKLNTYLLSKATSFPLEVVETDALESTGKCIKFPIDLGHALIWIHEGKLVYSYTC